MLNESTSLSQTSWLGQPALALETPALRLVTVPGMGAKIVSLFDKRYSREWLVPPTRRPFVPVDYGVQFDAQDMSGWDEMFPTIDACAYPQPGAHEGALLPDHGEVWPLPWAVDTASDGQLQMSVSGRALPYRLTRTITALSTDRLRLSYAVENTGAEAWVGLWAAHPQFAVDVETRIVLPPGVRQVVNVQASDNWPEVGALVSWPHAETVTGDVQSLDRVGPATLGKCRKFYVPPDVPVAWAALRQQDSGVWMRLSWDAADVPYLGVWVDEGAYNALPTAALEPSNGYYDALDIAARNGRVMQVPAGGCASWILEVSCGSGAL